jgi:hypothetical protein
VGSLHRRTFRRKGACGPSPCGVTKPDGRSWLPFEHGSHGGVPAPACSAGMCASQLHL